MAETLVDIVSKRAAQAKPATSARRETPEVTGKPLNFADPRKVRKNLLLEQVEKAKARKGSFATPVIGRPVPEVTAQPPLGMPFGVAPQFASLYQPSPLIVGMQKPLDIFHILGFSTDVNCQLNVPDPVTMLKGLATVIPALQPYITKIATATTGLTSGIPTQAPAIAPEPLTNGGLRTDEPKALEQPAVVPGSLGRAWAARGTNGLQ